MYTNIHVYNMFLKMGKISGFILQSKKCVVIPLVPEYSNIYPCYSLVIKRFFPAWSHFCISTHAEYLGFEIGPKAGAVQWEKVLNSVNTQVHTLSACACILSTS